MACDCIENVNEELPDYEALRTAVNTKTGEARPEIKTLSGRVIFPTYCPFCGEEYQQNDAD